MKLVILFKEDNFFHALYATLVHMRLRKEDADDQIDLIPVNSQTIYNYSPRIGERLYVLGIGAKTEEESINISRFIDAYKDYISLWVDDHVDIKSYCTYADQSDNYINICRKETIYEYLNRTDFPDTENWKAVFEQVLSCNENTILPLPGKSQRYLNVYRFLEAQKYNTNSSAYQLQIMKMMIEEMSKGEKIIGVGAASRLYVKMKESTDRDIRSIINSQSFQENKGSNKVFICNVTDPIDNPSKNPLKKSIASLRIDVKRIIDSIMTEYSYCICNYQYGNQYHVILKSSDKLIRRITDTTEERDKTINLMERIIKRHKKKSSV